MKSVVVFCLALAITTASCGLLPASTTLLKTPLVKSNGLGHSFSYSTVQYTPVASPLATYQAAPLYTSPLLQQHLQFLQQFSPIYQTPIFGGNPIYQTPIFGGQPVADVPVSQPAAPAQTPVAGTPLDEDTVAVDAAV